MTAVLVGVLFLVPAAAAAVYYAALTHLGWRARRRFPTDGPPPPRHSFVVLIPAHNEELTLIRSVRSIHQADYPEEMVRTLVVADNCTDRTADIATALRAECVERYDPDHRGKGYALAFGMKYALATGADAVLVLDADCELSPSALRAIDATLSDGAAVVQTAVNVPNPDGEPRELVAAVGAELDNAVAAGRTRLGRPVILRGTGMAFRRAVLERHPWSTFGLAEDAEYSDLLERAGVRVVFAPDARVRSLAPPGTAALCVQRRRWRAALFAGGFARKWVESKPLVLAQLAATVVVVAGLAAWMPPGWAVGLLGWAAGLVALTGWVYLRAVRRVGSAGGARGLLGAAVVVARIGWVTVCGFFTRGQSWERTPRSSEPIGDPA